VKLNGEVMYVLGSTDGERTFNLPVTENADKFAFAYTAGEGDTGGAILSAFRRNTGSAMMLR
jgi:hypothetical protein